LTFNKTPNDHGGNIIVISLNTQDEQEALPINPNMSSTENIRMEYRLEKLGQYLWGWFGYYGISQYYRSIPELDEWIRRRVRMCYWKQWHWARTKIWHLLDLSMPLKAARQHGVRSLSYWRMARTPVTQRAMSNDWLRAQGLLSIKDLWCKTQGYGPAKG